jgi:purine-binding chemotaxis protein CheW
MEQKQTSGSGQYLTLTLGEEDFAIEISHVREVVDYKAITKVPRMPEHLCGVINLRGNVVSVIDIGLKLGMDPIQKTTDTCIVIVETDTEGETSQMGVLADSVHEVIDLDFDRIEAPPKIGTKLNTEFVLGMGKRDTGFVIILNIDRLLADEESAEEQNAAEN